MYFKTYRTQGRRQKIFQGGANEKKTKLAKKYWKMALFRLFQGGQRKKDWKIAKNAEK